MTHTIKKSNVKAATNKKNINCTKWGSNPRDVAVIGMLEQFENRDELKSNALDRSAIRAIWT